MSNPQVSIVIRCFNEEEHIGRLLSGVMQQSIKDVEIIIVDSGSTDATLSIASRYPVKVCSIKSEDFSFGRSLNLGCQAATGEFIVIVSAHVYPVCHDWLESILSPFDDPQVALVYGKQRGDKTTKYSEHQVFAKWFPDESEKDQGHPFCNNANAAIRRSVWTELPYNDSLTGLEDLDWAKRAVQLNHKIAYAAEAEIVHVHNETPKSIFNRYRREAIAFKNIFPEERFTFFSFCKLAFTNIFTDYFHAFFDGVLLKNLKSIPVFRFMQFWGTYYGYAQHRPVTKHLKQTFYYPRGISRNARSIQNDSKSKVIDYSSGEGTGEKVH